MSEVFDYFECRSCGYRINGASYQLLIHDFGCPRCDRTLANFTGRLKKEEDIKIDKLT